MDPSTTQLQDLKAVLDLYLAQYSATDKLWAYFSTVTLAVIGFSVGSEKVSKSFLEASVVVGGYLVFCVGNYKALSRSQDQLVQFADLARAVADKHNVPMTALVPFESAHTGAFYWAVALAVGTSVLLITWRRRRAANAFTRAADN